MDGACDHPRVQREASPTEGRRSRGAAVRQTRQRATRIVARLREAGHQALFAGGCVRDLLLGIDPADYDIATSAPASVVQQIFPRTVPVGVQFGVVIVLEDGEPFQVATFRRDGAYVDHRHPVSVEFSDARHDAERRDFTVNGMFLDPQTDEVLDYVGGRADLAAGIVRAIGDPYARFDEDRLRLLRAVRFAARFGWTIEPATFAAIVKLAPTVTGIAWERIGDEIVKILGEGHARRGFELLNESGLLDVVLPEIAALRGVAQSADHHPEGDVFTHTLLCLDKLERDRHGEALALAVLLHDVAKPQCAVQQPGGRITFHGHCEQGAPIAESVVERLRRSRDVADRVAWLVEHHLRHLDAPRMRVAKLKRFLAEPWIEDLLELVRIDALSASGDLSHYEFCRTKRAELLAAEPLPEPLLRGRDLIALGHRPGPRFREILDGAFDAQLEGAITTAEEAREWVRQRYPSQGDEALQ
jgi:poly(A) polymerase